MFEDHKYASPFTEMLGDNITDKGQSMAELVGRAIEYEAAHRLMRAISRRVDTRWEV
jgi:hypothetical protein